MEKRTKLTLIRTNLRRFTFENKRMKNWVEDRSSGTVLNLFAGKTILDLNEIRNDIDESMISDFHADALHFVIGWDRYRFNTIILDPPYSYRKAMEMYNGHLNSKFKLLADEIPRILSKEGKVISFGYHSTFLGKKRNFNLDELCIFAHGGAQHCTIGIVESRNPENDK